MTPDPSLEALLAAELAPATDADAEALVAEMESVGAQPGGLALLARTFAGSRVDVLVRALTFVLARTASSTGDPSAVADAVWLAVRAIATGDDWARVNLLGAVHVLGARDAIAAEAMPPALGAFIADALGRGEDSVAAAAAVLDVLDAHGLLARLDPRALRAIADRLDAAALTPGTTAAADVAAVRRRVAELSRPGPAP